MSNSETAPGHGPQVLMQMIQGAQVTALITTAVELGVFGLVAKGARTCQQIAEGIKAPPRSTEVLLDGLAVLGLLAKNGTSYENAPLSEEHLVPGKPMYMGDITGIFGPGFQGATAKGVDVLVAREDADAARELLDDYRAS